MSHLDPTLDKFSSNCADKSVKDVLFDMKSIYSSGVPLYNLSFIKVGRVIKLTTTKGKLKK